MVGITGLNKKNRGVKLFDHYEGWEDGEVVSATFIENDFKEVSGGQSSLCPNLEDYKIKRRKNYGND